jgi:hypothetical protein
MRITLFIISLLLYSSIEGALPDDDEIHWTKRQTLTFDDFQSMVPDNTSWAALTSSYIYFTYGTSNGNLTSMRVYASFRKKESWMKIKNENVLAHEQLHFDITEVFTRKLYSEAQELKGKKGNIPQQVKDLFNTINDQCDLVQRQYDNETVHGTRNEEQEVWKKKVAQMLIQYPEYPDETN